MCILFVIFVVVLEFFIKVTQVRPQLIYAAYPKVFAVMYEVLKEGDDIAVGVVINAIISLACSWDCKIVLDTPTASITCGFQGIVKKTMNIKKSTLENNKKF